MQEYKQALTFGKTNKDVKIPYIIDNALIQNR